jgi:hypothetical protein
MNNIVPFMLVAVMVYAPTLVLRVWLRLDEWSLTTLGLGVLLDSVIAAIVTYGVLMDLQGTRPSYKDVVLTGLRRAPFVLGVVLLSSIATGIGFVLLVVPGIIMATMVYVAVPVALVERPGIMASLHRSRDLTDGYKGALFVILLALWVVKAALVRWFGAMLSSDLLPYASVVAQAICGVFAAITTAVAYTLLRADHEGVAVPDLATAIVSKYHGKTA